MSINTFYCPKCKLSVQGPDAHEIGRNHKCKGSPIVINLKDWSDEEGRWVSLGRAAKGQQ